MENMNNTFNQYDLINIYGTPDCFHRCHLTVPLHLPWVLDPVVHLFGDGDVLLGVKCQGG